MCRRQLDVGVRVGIVLFALVAAVFVVCGSAALELMAWSSKEEQRETGGALVVEGGAAACLLACSHEEESCEGGKKELGLLQQLALLERKKTK